jgi:hypothetical protein
VISDGLISSGFLISMSPRFVFLLSRVTNQSNSAFDGDPILADISVANPGSIVHPERAELNLNSCVLPLIATAVLIESHVTITFTVSI